MTIPFLTLRGDARARGLRHGRELRRQIAANIEAYMGLFAVAGLEAEDLQRAGADWGRLIASTAPDYHEEMAAVAEGAEADPALVAMLNARYEFAYSQTAGGNAAAVSPEAAAAGADGCTAIGIEAQRSAGGHVLLAQTWDWHEALLGGSAVIAVEAPDRPRSIALTEAGVVGGKIGLNECGIGLLVNGLCTTLDGRGERQVPFHVRCARILAADRFDEALRPIVETPHFTSANFLVAQAGGEMIDVEVEPGGYRAFYPKDGLLAHANHFESFQADSVLERLGPHSLFRPRRLRRLVAESGTTPSLDGLKSALADHYSYPASICRHVDERRGQRRLMTLAAVAMDLDDQVMEVADGPPCSHPWTRFQLS